MPTESESHGSEHEQEDKYPLPKEHEKAQESYASPAKSADSYETENSHEPAHPPAPPKSSSHFESGGGHDSHASKSADQHSEPAPSHGLSFQTSIPASPKHVVKWKEILAWNEESRVRFADHENLDDRSKDHCRLYKKNELFCMQTRTLEWLNVTMQVMLQVAKY